MALEPTPNPNSEINSDNEKILEQTKDLLGKILSTEIPKDIFDWVEDSLMPPPPTAGKTLFAPAVPPLLPVAGTPGAISLVTPVQWEEPPVPIRLLETTESPLRLVNKPQGQVTPELIKELRQSLFSFEIQTLDPGPDVTEPKLYYKQTLLDFLTREIAFSEKIQAKSGEKGVNHWILAQLLQIVYILPELLQLAEEALDTLYSEKDPAEENITEKDDPSSTTPNRVGSFLGHGVYLDYISDPALVEPFPIATPIQFDLVKEALERSMAQNPLFPPKSPLTENIRNSKRIPPFVGDLINYNHEDYEIKTIKKRTNEPSTFKLNFDPDTFKLLSTEDENKLLKDSIQEEFDDTPPTPSESKS